jgi:hypothetical protein
MKRIVLAFTTFVALAQCGCEQKPPAPPAGANPGAGGNNPRVAPSVKPTPDGETNSAGSTHAAGASHDGEIVELGTTVIGEITVRASRDKGEIKPGGDAAFDVWLTTADGKPATVSAVRIWIGTRDAKGSIKAKAEIEDRQQPNRWHTHAEVPNPLPEGAKLWVEAEQADGKKSAGSFELKP